RLGGQDPRWRSRRRRREEGRPGRHPAAAPPAAATADTDAPQVAMPLKEAPMRIRLALLVTTLVLTASMSQAQLDPSKWLKSDAGSSLSTGDIVAGLKQALEVGTTDTV